LHFNSLYLCYSSINFDIFGVQNSKSFSILIVNKICRVTVLLLFAYLLLPSICARAEENVETVNDVVLRQEHKPQTHRTVREISRETGIHQSSVSQITCKDLHLKCFKRSHAQELTDTNCAAHMKRAKLLLQKFLQYATDFVFFMDKKMFSVTSPDNRQNKVSGKLRELLKKKLSVFFCAGLQCGHCVVCHCLATC